MKMAYVDPPYLGCCGLYDHAHVAPYGCWDDPETHRTLIERVNADFPDGWAMSASSPSLRTILPMCPVDVRVGVWAKSFASFKPNVNPAYCWEPVIFRGGRDRTREDATVRDYCVVPITLKRGFTGAKPEAFCWWVFDLLGLDASDEFHDMFAGSGAVARAWDAYRANLFQPEASA